MIVQMLLTMYLEGAKTLRFFDGVCTRDMYCIRHHTAANVAGPADQKPPNKCKVLPWSSRQRYSWFSTGLFVLATGMRLWSHLVERIRTHTGELHDLIHYPAPHSSSAAHSDLEMRVLGLENKLKKMGKR